MSTPCAVWPAAASPSNRYPNCSPGRPCHGWVSCQNDSRFPYTACGELRSLRWYMPGVPNLRSRKPLLAMAFSTVGFPPLHTNVGAAYEANRSTSCSRPDRMGPTSAALPWLWKTRANRVRLSLTISSKTMSAVLKPLCGRARRRVVDLDHHRRAVRRGLPVGQRQTGQRHARRLGRRSGGRRQRRGGRCRGRLGRRRSRRPASCPPHPSARPPCRRRCRRLSSSRQDQRPSSPRRRRWWGWWRRRRMLRCLRRRRRPGRRRPARGRRAVVSIVGVIRVLSAG